MRRISGLVVLSLSVLVSAGQATVHAARLNSASAPSCTVSPLAPGGLQGIAPGGSFFALMPQAVPVNSGTKIVFRVTGHGPLTITAIGPDGRALSPDSLRSHPPGSSSWTSVPGDEWGSGWTFPTPACWHLHAVRTDLVGDIYFAVKVPQLVDMSFTIAVPRRHPLHSGQKIVFSLQADVQPGAGYGERQAATGQITIRHAGRRVRVLHLQGDVNILGGLQASTRLRTRSSGWFRAVATLTFRHVTLRRTMRFQVFTP